MPNKLTIENFEENASIKLGKSIINKLTPKQNIRSESLSCRQQVRITLSPSQADCRTHLLSATKSAPVLGENCSDVDEQEVFASRHLLLQSIEEERPPLGNSSNQINHKSRCPGTLKNVRIGVMVLIWLVSSYALMAKQERIITKHQISVPRNATKGYLISERIISENLRITLEGALLPPYYSNLSSHFIEVWVQLMMALYLPLNLSELERHDYFFVKNISEVWKVPIVSGKLIGVVPEVTHEKIYKLKDVETHNSSSYFLKVKLKTNLKTNFPVSLTYNLQPINKDNGIIYACLVLLGLYILMIFEVIHRTLAAMVASTMSVAILAALDDRPTLAEIISWIDIETLILLFSMMILVAFFTETGIFDYLSVLAYKLTGGKVWPLINTLCIFTVVLSCFLDNVTTALLMTPVTIRLCEVMKLNPVPVLMSMIIYSNVGGAITPIGDPPNVIIASNAHVIKAGITFSIFTLHMGVGSILALVVVFFHLRHTYRNMNDLLTPEPAEVQGLKREIAVWQRAAASMSSYSLDEEAVKESLKKRTTRLLGRLNTRAETANIGGSNRLSHSQNQRHLDHIYRLNLRNLQAQYPIKHKVLLVKSTIVLAFVVTVFFMHSIPAFSRLGLGWTALLGALLLLLLSGTDDLEAILARVEWSTLMFFASLFVVMEALSRLGLIEWIGRLTHDVIMSVGQESRLAVAILLIMWVSAVVSAFVDNIPLTTMMIRIATNLADNTELALPLQPLIWALSFGACLGGNGTLFGSSSNIVCAGVAEQHGYRFSFIQFMKVGFPIMVTTLSIVSVYLMIAHVLLQWH